MKSPMPYLRSAAISGLIAILVVTQTAFTQVAVAQDQSMQAAQQAAQDAQQAAQQATQTAQQAAQQAQQDALAAAQSSSSIPIPLGGVNHPPAPQAPGGPLPARIASAHTVLLTNVGITALSASTRTCSTTTSTRACSNGATTSSSAIRRMPTSSFSSTSSTRATAATSPRPPTPITARLPFAS